MGNRLCEVVPIAVNSAFTFVAFGIGGAAGESPEVFEKKAG
jgi:hypothetical protein